ncbi:multiheme c-type cytochrome [Nitratifractor sp.]|uniref:multiheme c-type cytochrome n=1 Tax=Nitratifractor sp. TaxID=2268144 RepID=UPI0025CC9BCA|nr:multiheme c-type cytochrome [Nitratifractor sp.]
MRLFILFWLLGSLSALFGVETAPTLDSKYHDSSKCKACHGHIVKPWSHSYHARSHYKKDEYFRKTIDYVAKKTFQPVNAIKVYCAACHNPRISVTSTDMSYEIKVLMGEDKNSAVNKAVNDSAISEGINCLVCHNINKIKEHLPPSKRGVHRIRWNPVGTMSGPFKDADSPYHKTQYREFFDTNSKQLCFVCHANERSIYNVEFTNTQKEYVKTDKQCIECHMGPKKEGFASSLPIDHGKPRKRMVREHSFMGGHFKQLWKGALGLKAKREGKDLSVTILNPNPHNIPTGFGARELIVEVTYRDASQKVLATKSVSITPHYRDRDGKATLPHLATKIIDNPSIPAQGEKTLTFPLVKGSKQITIEIYYRLVNDEVRGLLHLKEAQWSEKKFVNRTTLEL